MRKLILIILLVALPFSIATAQISPDRYITGIGQPSVDSPVLQRAKDRPSLTFDMALGVDNQFSQDWEIRDGYQYKKAGFLFEIPASTQFNIRFGMEWIGQGFAVSDSQEWNFEHGHEHGHHHADHHEGHKFMAKQSAMTYGTYNIKVGFKLYLDKD